MPNPICADSNIFVRVLLADASDLVSAFNDWVTTGRRVLVPALAHYEVASALLTYVIPGQISPDQADRLLLTFLELGIEIVDDDSLHRAALRVAGQERRLSTYDAHFLALAQRAGAELWTADGDLAKISQRLGVATVLWKKPAA